MCGGGDEAEEEAGDTRVCLERVEYRFQSRDIFCFHRKERLFLRSLEEMWIVGGFGRRKILEEPSFWQSPRLWVGFGEGDYRRKPRQGNGQLVDTGLCKCFGERAVGAVALELF